MSAPIDWYMGVAHFTQGSINEAKICFDAAYKLHPYHIHVLNNLASCYESLGNHQHAISLYSKALDISKDFEESLLNLAAVYFNISDIQKAFETISKCSIYSENPNYRVYLKAILKSWMEHERSKQKDFQTLNRINELLSTDNLMVEVFLGEKKKNISFEEFVFGKNYKNPK
jgi:tetratricopeptide (TPR) repeat protein